MKYILKFFIVYCYITPLFSQNSLSFALTSEHFSQQTNYTNASGISIGFMHQMASQGEWGVKFNFKTLSLNVSSPSTNTAVNVSVLDYYLVYGYSFTNMISILDLKPVMGVGFKVLNRESFQIDLGALGEKTSPDVSKTYFSSFIGLVFSRRITDNFNIFFQPGYSLYDAQKFHDTFSIKGGIDVMFN